MSMKRIGTLLVIIALFALAGTALARTTKSAIHQTDESGKNHKKGHGHKGDKSSDWFDKDAMIDAMAVELSVDVGELEEAMSSRTAMNTFLEVNELTHEELKAAAETAKQDAIAQAVVNGDLTQEEADSMTSRQGRHGKGEHKGQHEKPDWFDEALYMETVATELGTTVEALTAAKEDGTIKALMESLNVTKKDKKAAHETAMKATLDQAVANGDLTQEKADEMTSHQGHHGKGKHKRGGHDNHHDSDKDAASTTISDA